MKDNKRADMELKMQKIIEAVDDLLSSIEEDGDNVTMSLPSWLKHDKLKSKVRHYKKEYSNV